MNLLLFKPEQLKNTLVEITQPETITHIQTVLKLSVGNSLRVGELNGLLGEGTIESISPQKITLSTKLHTKPAMALPCTLVLALPRPQQLKRILVHVSSLGIKHIHLLQTARVEKNYWQSPKLKDIERYLIEGLEQAVDTILPKVHLHTNYREFMQDTLPSLKENKQLWIAHPGNYPPATKQDYGEHVLFIGPEGGFIPAELEQLLAEGVKGISLGERILKVETAIPVLLGSMFL